METVFIILGIIVAVILVLWVVAAIVAGIKARKVFKMTENAFQNVFRVSEDPVRNNRIRTTADKIRATNVDSSRIRSTQQPARLSDYLDSAAIAAIFASNTSTSPYEEPRASESSHSSHHSPYDSTSHHSSSSHDYGSHSSHSSYDHGSHTSFDHGSSHFDGGGSHF